MAMTRQLSLETRQSIVVLRKEGYSMQEIARKLKISIHAVHYSLKRKEATGSNGNRRRSGRPKTTSPAEDKYIRVSSLRNRCLTCPQITAGLNNTREMPVCSSTVRRRLCGAGLMGFGFKNHSSKKRTGRKGLLLKTGLWMAEGSLV
nr:uncharacterized protein LOC129276894 [Lytechinus pictus]